MPLREVLFGVSVATLVPTTLVGTTLATSFHIVETVLGTRLRWDHAIVVEKVETIESEPWGAAQVIDGARACPPEDVGGPHGYEAFLSALCNDPNSEEADHYRNWVGPGFDAELFDLRAANATLLRMASNRWGNR